MPLSYLIRSIFLFQTPLNWTKNWNKVENCYCAYIDAYECVCAMRRHNCTIQLRCIQRTYTHTKSIWVLSLFFFSLFANCRRMDGRHLQSFTWNAYNANFLRLYVIWTELYRIHKINVKNFQFNPLNITLHQMLT